jgi:hypothetical protein
MAGPQRPKFTRRGAVMHATMVRFAGERTLRALPPERKHRIISLTDFPEATTGADALVLPSGR